MMAPTLLGIGLEDVCVIHVQLRTSSHVYKRITQWLRDKLPGLCDNLNFVSQISRMLSPSVRSLSDHGISKVSTRSSVWEFIQESRCNYLHHCGCKGHI